METKKYHVNRKFFPHLEEPTLQSVDYHEKYNFVSSCSKVVKSQRSLAVSINNKMSLISRTTKPSTIEHIDPMGAEYPTIVDGVVV